MAEAPEAIDERSIANKAMILLGSGKRIETFEDRDSADAQDLIALWSIARRATLVLHPFNFAIHRQLTDRDADQSREALAGMAPAFSYTLPSDCLRWLPWSRDDRAYFEAVEEGGKLLSDYDGPVVIRYLRDVPVLASWSPSAIDLAAYTLAMEYCHGKTQLLGLRDRLAADRAQKIEDAKRVDGLATANRERRTAPRQSRWAGARYTRNGY